MLRSFRVVTAGSDVHARNQRMLRALGVGRIAIDDEVSLLANVRDQTFDLPLVIVSLYEPQIQHCRRLGGNHVARQLAHVATRKAVDVQRRNVDQLQQRLARAFSATQTQLPLELFVILRRFGDGAAFAFTQEARHPNTNPRS